MPLPAGLAKWIGWRWNRAGRKSLIYSLRPSTCKASVSAIGSFPSRKKHNRRIRASIPPSLSLSLARGVYTSGVLCLHDHIPACLHLPTPAAAGKTPHRITQPPAGACEPLKVTHARTHARAHARISYCSWCWKVNLLRGCLIIAHTLTNRTARLLIFSSFRFLTLPSYEFITLRDSSSLKHPIRTGFMQTSIKMQDNFSKIVHLMARLCRDSVLAKTM